MDANINDRTPLQRPDYPDTTQAVLPSLPSRHANVPWPDMPEKMLVVIDGWSDMPKSLVGEWVAESLGGLLVDSEHIYRALVTACAKEGVDIDNYVRVGSWCERAGVDIGFSEEGRRALEANIGVNEFWSSKSDVAGELEQSSSMAACSTFWCKVNQIVRGCDFNDRVVIVGGNNRFEFPNTPYKFFLDGTNGNRYALSLAGFKHPLEHLKALNFPGANYLERSTNTVIIDANRLTPADVVVAVLVETVARACELGFVGAHPETALADAYRIADATRQRMKAALSQSYE